MRNGPGVFITFEGGEGAGKSTQLHALEFLLKACGQEVQVCREPGGTAVGETVRKMLLGSGQGVLDERAELLLFEAARAQLVSEVIAPALDAGKLVLCDRFTDSTLAYQGYGRGLDLGMVEVLNRFVTRGLEPDRTVLLELDFRTGLARAREVGGNRMEEAGEEFHRRVSEGFGQIARRFPRRIRTVRTCDDPARTCEDVIGAVSDLLDPQLVDGLRAQLAADPVGCFSRKGA